MPRTIARFSPNSYHWMSFPLGFASQLWCNHKCSCQIPQSQKPCFRVNSLVGYLGKHQNRYRTGLFTLMIVGCKDCLEKNVAQVWKHILQHSLKHEGQKKHVAHEESSLRYLHSEAQIYHWATLHWVWPWSGWKLRFLIFLYRFLYRVQNLSSSYSVHKSSGDKLEKLNQFEGSLRDVTEKWNTFEEAYGGTNPSEG